MFIKPSRSLKGEIHIPGDKSISHRSVMFGALADGLTEVTHFLHGADCLSTISCFKQLGVPIENTKDCIRIYGKGLHGLHPSAAVLDAGNSGTTIRLLSGILAGQPFASTLTGDASIQKRSMKRIITPLCQGLRPDHQPARRAPRQTARDTLYFACRFCAGKILCPARRFICR